MRGPDQQQTECSKKTAVIETMQQRALLQVDRHFGTRQQGVGDERVPRGWFACIASIRGPNTHLGIEGSNVPEHGQALQG